MPTRQKRQAPPEESPELDLDRLESDDDPMPDLPPELRAMVGSMFAEASKPRAPIVPLSQTTERSSDGRKVDVITLPSDKLNEHLAMFGGIAGVMDVVLTMGGATEEEGAPAFLDEVARALEAGEPLTLSCDTKSAGVRMIVVPPPASSR